MNKQLSVGLPTANITINKSRVKVYKTDVPTVYLQKGTEFQIELFNPTTNVILCKIHLNNKQISQGGLVLNPGQRVFLDRYLDVAKKFMFDTYEVSNTSEVKKAIEDNGDFKVEFYNEYIYKPVIYYENFNNYLNTIKINSPYYNTNTFNCCTESIGITNASLTSGNINNTLSCDVSEPNKSLLRSKSIETGRVEKGSDSEQKLTTVNKDWEFIPFHKIEYKLLPLSQKINTTSDLSVKRYCTNCANKLKPEHKFCSQCGKKI